MQAAAGKRYAAGAHQRHQERREDIRMTTIQLLACIGMITGSFLFFGLELLDCDLVLVYIFSFLSLIIFLFFKIPSKFVYMYDKIL